MGPLRRFGAVLWARQRLQQLANEGKSAEEAQTILDQEGTARFGAIDWATLIPIILALIEAFSSLFRKP